MAQDLNMLHQKKKKTIQAYYIGLVRLTVEVQRGAVRTAEFERLAGGNRSDPENPAPASLLQVWTISKVDMIGPR